MSENKVIDIDGVKVMVCGDDGQELPESDIEALREFIQFRKARKRNETRKAEVRKIANKLNDLGYPCCRCMDCKTCKMAEDIFDGKIMMPEKRA